MQTRSLICLFVLLNVVWLTACSSAPAAPANLQPSETQAPTVAAIAESTAMPTAAPTATTAPLTPTAAAAPTSTPTFEPVEGSLALARGTAPQRLITVLLDNHPNAYPQSGMDSATIVFEALAEYGITRYMAVYAPGISPDAVEIGPVRSARPYFVEWAQGFGAVFVHAGGSPAGLALAESAVEIANMDALLGSGSRYFWRNADRDAPHNLYTNSDELQQFIADQDAADFGPAAYGFLFKPDSPEDQRPASQQMEYYFIYAEDPVSWEYDPQANDYLRYRRGRAHIDARTGEQLRFKNVVVLEVQEELILGDDKGRIEQQVVGEGSARMFTDGVERDVRWSKPSQAAPLHLYDAKGDEVLFNAGSIWIAAIPSLDHLTVEGGD